MPNFRNNLSNSCGKMLCKYFLPTSLKVATVSTISKIFLTDLLIKVAFSFQSIFAQPNLIEAAKKQTKHRGMKQKKCPLKYFHQKITQHVKCDHHFLHAFFFIFNPPWQTNIVNIEAFLVFPSTCSEWLCVLFGGIFM